MAFNTPPVTDERSGLRAFLAQQQEVARTAAHGLTDEQAASAPSVSSLSVGGLLKHLAFTQDGWVDSVEAAPGFPVGHGYEEYAANFTMTPGESLESVLATYDASCARALAAVDRFDLDLEVPVPDAPWFPQDLDHWSARWVWLHLIEEFARHAGHADIVRESVDGADWNSLEAARLSLPETDWLKPWTPPS